MRLWHKDLIPLLPRQQLVGQWRECCLIAKQIAAKETSFLPFVVAAAFYFIANYVVAFVMERFENPFLNHKLLDISLNSVSKWRARDLPTVRETVRGGKTRTVETAAAKFCFPGRLARRNSVTGVITFTAAVFSSSKYSSSFVLSFTFFSAPRQGVRTESNSAIKNNFLTLYIWFKLL